MTTTTNFRGALAGFHAALAEFQGAVERIEENALEQQRMGCEALARANDAALQAGTRATCVIRATTDAEVLNLDATSNAMPVDGPTLHAAITTLDARLQLLQSARRQLDEAAAALNKQLEAAAAQGNAAKDKLTALCAGARK